MRSGFGPNIGENLTRFGQPINASDTVMLCMQVLAAEIFPLWLERGRFLLDKVRSRRARHPSLAGQEKSEWMR
jgi:hypothetical protein